jgi:hypothetical protein
VKDDYEYDKHHRPTFPYEIQWEEFKSLQRVRFWMFIILDAIGIALLSVILWDTFSDGVSQDFLVGMLVGSSLCSLGVIMTRPPVQRWLTRKR